MIKSILNKLGMLLCLLFGLNGCTPNNAELQQLIVDGAMLIDVRTEKEFAGGSAIGAINIPLSEVENRLAEFRNKQNIIVFCRSGNRSGKAMKILMDNGITNVTNGGTWKTVRKNQVNIEN